jgi:hypothetical protein
MPVIHKKASFTHTHAPTIDRSNFNHSTRDLLFVKESLDAEPFRTQWVYTRLVEWDQPDQWTVRRPITSKEEDELIEAEFEYVRFDDKLIDRCADLSKEEVTMKTLTLCFKR